MQLTTDKQKEIKHIYLHVLLDIIEQAKDRINLFAESNNVSAKLFTVVPGDITKPDLAIQEDTNLQLRKVVTHVFHLAAIYDLDVEKEAAFLDYVHVRDEGNG